MVLENTQSQKIVYIYIVWFFENLNQSGAWFTAPKRWAVVGPTQLLGECGYCFNENLNMQELFYSLKCVLPYYAGNMQDRVIIIAR